MRRLLIGVLLTTGVAFAQPDPPHFEVVSIKPCKSVSQSHTNASPGRLTFECVSLDELIRDAYVAFADGVTLPSRTLMALRSQKFKGAPPWSTSDRFTINAKADAPAGYLMMRGPMLRLILEDRFKLRTHRDPREFPIYELMVTGVPKLAPWKPGSCMEAAPDPFQGPPHWEKGQPPPLVTCGGFTPNRRTGGNDIRGTTMQELCVMLSGSVARDVIDKTRLDGRYDLHLDLTLDDLFPRSQPKPGEAPADPFSLLNSEFRKYGLKLQPSKMTAGFLVIDHAERPTQN